MEEISNIDSELNVTESEISKESVSRKDFDAAVFQYYDKANPSNRAQHWTKSRILDVIQTVEEYKTASSSGMKRSNIHYNRSRLYDIMEVGAEKFLILKRKTLQSPTIQIYRVTKKGKHLLNII
ncbi:hypothetical protein ABEB36_015308 [Hypothenemus hampei]|uniref:Uncharacterized protein n=1 Tax=Hypothenemus hampei TaxID=57062 RepID=A0ABD1DZU3_HYPHA